MYIALNPAGVVQHRLIAGSYRPLRVLFITTRTFSRFPQFKNSLKSLNYLCLFSKIVYIFAYYN